MYELAKTGRWLGGNTPLGYKSEKVETLSVDGKRKNLYKLDIVFEEAEIIKLIWNKMCELKSLSKLEVYLLQKGIKTRNGNNFTRFSLITILKNPVYVVADNKIKDFFEKMNVTIYETGIEKCNGINGLLAYNKREELMGKTKSYKDITEWIIAVGKHQGIIPSQQFIKVWNLIVNNKDKRCRVPRQNTSILSGIIRCKHCGNYMRPRLRNTVTIDNKRNFSYLCVLKEKSRKRLCKCKNINGIETDMIVIEKISELKLPTNMLINKIKLLINNKEKKSDKRINELQTLNTILSRNKRKVEALIDKMAIIDGELIADITAQIKSIKSKNLEIEKRIIELSKETEKEIDKDEVTVLALNIINKYMSSFDSLNIVDKRLMIKSLVNTIESDGENIYINYMGCP